MTEQLTKFRSEDVRQQRGTLARGARGTLPGTDAQKSSSLLAKHASLEPMSTRQVNRATQCIVLQFSTEQAAEEQGSCLRAVEQQKNGESGISTVKLINWARRNARVRAEVAALIGLSGRVTDPEFMEGLTKVLDYICEQERHDDAEHHAGEACDTAMLDLFGGE